MSVYAGISFFPISIAADASTRRDAAGSFLRYVSGDAGGADQRILVKPQGGAGGAVILYPGQTVRLPASVSSWQIENYANAATITGTVAIGDGAIEDDRITGEVSVIDGGRSRTLSGAAFSVGVVAAGSVGNYAHAQILNPSGSGKVITLTQIRFSLSGAGAISGLRYDTALATLYGSPPSKRIGGAASAAECRSEANASTLGTGLVMVAAYAPASQEAPPLVLTEPIVLDAGKGFLVRANVTATNLAATFQGFEDNA
jgi:hypothetical protein